MNPAFVDMSQLNMHLQRHQRNHGVALRLFVNSLGNNNEESFYNNPYDPTTSTTNVPNPNEDVSVPSVTFRPCRQLEQQLRLVDPLTPSNNRGCDIYYLVTDIVDRHLSNGCNHC